MTVAISTRPRVRELAILDQYGREVESAPRRVVAAPNPRGMQTYNSNPVVGLTVESLMGYFRSASLGAPIRQMDLFDNLLERLPEMRGMFEERNDDIAGADWTITPPPGVSDKPSLMAAEALQEYLQYNVSSNLESRTADTSSCFRKWLKWQGTSVPFGYACTNMVWDYVDGMVFPTQFQPIAHRRFGAPSADKAHEIWLIDGKSGGFDLQELDAGLWSVTRRNHRNVYEAGLMRSCAWWALFALTGFKQWQIFADMFGLPLAIGYYEEGAGERSRHKLEEAVRSIGQDGYAILSALTELVIKETARGGDSSTVYPMIFDACMRQITTLITGGTLNTDVSSTGAGSYNAATVHESRAYKMHRGDATALEDEFAVSVALPFKVWNGFDRAAVPRLRIKISRDDLARAQTLEILGMAMPLSARQIQDEFNLRAPIDKSDEVSWKPTEAPDPNRARQDRKR